MRFPQLVLLLNDFFADCVPLVGIKVLSSRVVGLLVGNDSHFKLLGSTLSLSNCDG